MKMKTFFSLAMLLTLGMPGLVSAEPLELRKSHAFTFSEARERVQLMLDYWKTRYGVHVYWAGTRAHVSGRLFGIDVDAVLEVNGKEVSGEFQDPGPLFRRPARDYIQKKLQKYLHPHFQDA